MGDTLDWWLQDGDWYDRKQQKAIRELERSTAHARSQTRSLQQRVDKNQASLTRRVDQLERALRAVVELEDVREELNQHVPAALVRRYARSVVMAISGLNSPHSSAPIPDAPSDVAGYWLAPATRWAASLLSPDLDQEALAEAQRRDALRSDLFVVSLAAISDQSIDSSSSLARLLSTPFEVFDWQRELWCEIARGRFGPDAHASLVSVLAPLAANVTRDHLSAAAIGASSVARPIESGRRLAALAQRIAPTATSELAQPVDGDISESDEPISSRDDRIAELLAVIVDEGAPGEVEVLDSMSDIRRVLADDAAMKPPKRRVVDDSVSAPLALLLADLGSENAALRAVAVEVLAEEITDWAHDLHDAAATAAAPTTAVDVFGHNIAITAAAVDESEYIEHIEAAHPLEPAPTISPVGLVGLATTLVGALLVTLAGLIGVVLALVGIAVVGWAGRKFVQQRMSVQRSAARRDAAQRRCVHQVNEATKRIAVQTADFEAVTSTIDGSLARILSRLERGAQVPA